MTLSLVHVQCPILYSAVATPSKEVDLEGVDTFTTCHLGEVDMAFQDVSDLGVGEFFHRITQSD